MLPRLSAELDFSSCLPALPGVDWSMISRRHFVFVGTGAVNRPLARLLAWLGMKRCLLIDPKRYKAQSIVSQCESHEVGRFKSEVLAEELRHLGVSAEAMVKDVDVVPPGYLEENSLVVLAVDNRRADICANRWAGRMRVPVVKINVEPAYLTASVRCYDLRQSPPAVCAECQMSDRHYEQQLHPLSCDGGGPEQPTGSPRPLSLLAASAGALAVAQLVGSPDEWANRWWGKQWQQNLLGGQGGFSELLPNPNCRWDHSLFWGSLTSLTGSQVTLAELARDADWSDRESLAVEFSGRLASRLACSECRGQKEGVWWVGELDKPVTSCECGGDAYAVPFFTHRKLPAGMLSRVWEMPMGAWGVPAGAVLRLYTSAKSRAYRLPVGSLGTGKSAEIRP